MKIYKTFVVLAAMLLSHSLTLLAQDSDSSDAIYKTETYKEINGKEFIVRIFEPDYTKFKGVRPAAILYHGGGWNGGSITLFEPQAKYFTDRGMIVILPNYRVSSRDKTTPYECVKDAKSAFRYVRANAERLNIDPDKIAAGGGSAGGHMAAALGTIEGFNEESDDLGVSCVPNALLLFNPVLDNGPGGFGYDRVAADYKDFSPLHNLDKDVPPTITVLGDQDNLIPVVTLQYFNDMLVRVGVKSEFYVYEGGKHSFWKSEPFKSDVLSKMDNFLVAIGFLEPIAE